MSIAIAYSSISERLSIISPAYFQKIYQHCVHAYKSVMAPADQQNLVRFDSTIVSLSGKLIDMGYHLNGRSSRVRQIKFSIGYTDIPEVVKYYDQQKYNAENAALKETILADRERDPLQVRVFDRGITGRATYDAFSEAGIRFISRINPGAAHKQQDNNLILEDAPVQTPTLLIEEDIAVSLNGWKTGKTRYPLRCIKAKSLKEEGKEIWFVTNISAAELSAAEVSEIYRKRWDIEVFFRFMKQHLNFSHLLNRSANGIQVMMYVTMVAAILVIAYRKMNGFTGFKLPKQKLAQELEKEIIRTIVAYCGGNPDKLSEIRPLNSS
jgi:hypothetical protein